MTIISYHAWFTAFVITSTVEETTFESDEATFESNETSFNTDETTFELNQTAFSSNVTTFKSNVTTFKPDEAPFVPRDLIDKSRASRGAARDEVTFVTNVVMFDSNVVKFGANEVSFGGCAFSRRINTTLSEAFMTTFASDAPFFTTEQVTSVAKEIIGDAPVMCFVNDQQTNSKEKEPMTQIRCLIGFGNLTDPELMGTTGAVLKGLPGRSFRIRPTTALGRKQQPVLASDQQLSSF